MRWWALKMYNLELDIPTMYDKVPAMCDKLLQHGSQGVGETVRSSFWRPDITTIE